MCRLMFRGGGLIAPMCVCNSPSRAWVEVRYVVEVALGISDTDDNAGSVVLGFRSGEDERNNITLADNYEVQHDDDIVLKRYPFGSKHQRYPRWLPPSVIESQHERERTVRIQEHRAEVAAEHNEMARLNLIKSNWNLRSAQPRTERRLPPSHTVALRKVKCIGWRVDATTISPILPPSPGPDYTCPRCLNTLDAPPHLVEDCPTAHVIEAEWKWLSKRRPPTGVPWMKRRRLMTPVKTVNDLTKVEWVDTGEAGEWRLWLRR